MIIPAQRRPKKASRSLRNREIDRIASKRKRRFDECACLVIGPAARWFRSAEGTRVHLWRYGPLRRVLFSLVQHRLSHPGVALDVYAVIEAGWPGEKMQHDAALARAYTTIRRLRSFGLRQGLVTSSDGYLLHSNLLVTIEED